MNTNAPRVAVVTGAGSGIGRVASRAFAAQGWRVAAVDRDTKGLEATAEHADRIIPIVADVTEGAKSLVDEILEKVGVPTRVMNNAGICRIGPADSISQDEIAATFDVNVFAAIRLCQATIPLMRDNGGGQIINVASLAGILPTPQLSIYAASKAALLAYTDVLFQEMKGSTIQVVCACPPVVETPMVDSMREQSPTVLGGQRGIHPMDVVAAIEQALETGSLLAFPGQAKTVWRMKRFAPWFLQRQLNRLQPESSR